MKNEIVSVQTDAINNPGFLEDAEIGWLSLDEDYACLEASQKKVINQKLMKEEIVGEDQLLLRKLRLLASCRNNDKLKHPLTVESIGAMPSGDARILLAAFDRMNSVTGAEKSGPAEQDSAGAGDAGATLKHESDPARDKHDEKIRAFAGTNTGTSGADSADD